MKTIFNDLALTAHGTELLERGSKETSIQLSEEECQAFGLSPELRNPEAMQQWLSHKKNT